MNHCFVLQSVLSIGVPAVPPSAIELFLDIVLRQRKGYHSGGDDGGGGDGKKGEGDNRALWSLLERRRWAQSSPLK